MWRVTRPKSTASSWTRRETLIPRFCPEWTDHNVSDPGIALIELFAWMTESMLYRLNQVPEKTHITFLDMVGSRLYRRRPRSRT